MGNNSQFEAETGYGEFKTDELEGALERLQQLKFGETGDLELFKLKKLILTFKKKYKQACTELGLKDKGQSNDVVDLRRELREAQENNNALIEQLAAMKGLLEKVIASEKNLPNLILESWNLKNSKKIIRYKLNVSKNS